MYNLVLVMSSTSLLGIIVLGVHEASFWSPATFKYSNGRDMSVHLSRGCCSGCKDN